MKVINGDYYFGTDKKQRLLVFNKHLAFPTKEKKATHQQDFSRIQSNKENEIHCE